MTSDTTAGTRPPTTRPLVMHFPADYTPGETRQFRLSQAMAEYRSVYFIRDVALTRTSRFHLAPKYRLGPQVGAVQVIDRDVGRGFAGVRRRSWRLASLINKVSLGRFFRSIALGSRIVYSIGPHADFAVRGPSTVLAIEVNDPPFEGDAERTWQLFRSVAAKADLLLATAPALQRQLGAVTGTAHLVCNAVGSDLAHTASAATSPEPNFLLYVGTIDWRFDLEFVVDLARRAPNWTITCAGRINAERSQAVARHSGVANLQFLGAISETDKVDLLRCASVGLVPFSPGPIGDCINPTKVYEYAAYGLPILSTNTDACRALAPVVRTTSTGAEAADFLNQPDLWPTRAHQVAFAQSNTWEHRASAIEALLSQLENRLS